MSEPFREEYITCPFCGNVNNEWCDYPWGDDFDKDEDETRVWCDECEKWFRVVLHVDYSFSSYKKDGEELGDA